VHEDQKEKRERGWFMEDLFLLLTVGTLQMKRLLYCIGIEAIEELAIC
jgi:hypothetical protein